jgi:6-phosphogluconolactonase
MVTTETARHELEVLADGAAVARRGAAVVAERARAAVAAGRRFTLAVSGGTTPRAMFRVLRDEDVPWDLVTIYQVDERLAPDGDPDRNLTHLQESLRGVAVTVRPMPVTDVDPEAAAARYAAALPERFDVVHLGLGDDGHTASLVPGDPVLEVSDRAVALTGEYRGRRRMTLTYPALARAEQLLWLVTGAGKAGPLARLRAGDRSIPAGRVRAVRSLVLADLAAAGPGCSSSGYRGSPSDEHGRTA